jgi:hypothetical protein
MSPEFTLFISVEAMEINCSEAGMEVVETAHRFLEVVRTGGSHGSNVVQAWLGLETMAWAWLRLA